QDALFTLVQTNLPPIAIIRILNYSSACARYQQFVWRQHVAEPPKASFNCHTTIIRIEAAYSPAVINALCAGTSSDGVSMSDSARPRLVALKAPAAFEERLAVLVFGEVGCLG